MFVFRPDLEDARYPILLGLLSWLQSFSGVPRLVDRRTVCDVCETLVVVFYSVDWTYLLVTGGHDSFYGDSTYE